MGKKQWDESKPNFITVPEDTYVLRVFEVKPEELKAKYNSPDEFEKQVTIILDIVSLKDGSEAKDNEGKNALGRKIFFTARPDSMGFKEKGTVPSITRQFVYYIQGKDPFSDEALEFDFAEFKGSTINALVIEKQNLKGNMTNKIDRFMKGKSEVIK